MSTKVAFVKDRTDGEVVAVFPEEKHNRFISDDVVMYLHHGQHTSGSLEWAREQEPTTLLEIVDLYNELERGGYDDLELVEL